jgi:hypothetical protein
MVSAYSFFRGRRKEARRADDRQGGYYVDRYGSVVFVLFIVVVGLNAVDAFLAFIMLHVLGDVDNFLIRAMRDMGGETFIVAAFLIGSLCALFLFLHKNFWVARFAIGAVIVFQVVTISTQLVIILFFRAT